MYQKRIGLHIAVPTSEDVLYSYSSSGVYV